MTLFTAAIPREDLRSILNAVTVLVEECRVVMEDNEMEILGAEDADVAVVQINISQDAFNDSQMEEVNVCIDFKELTEMVKTAGTDAIVDLELEDHDLYLSMLDLSFTLPLINPDHMENDREKPELDLPCEIVIEDSAFKRGIAAADLIADHIEFGVNEKPAFYMKAERDDSQVVLKRQGQDLGTLTAKQVSSTYSVEYLKDMCDAIPSNADVRITLDEDYPAEISFDILDGDATVTYFIAPRLEPSV